MNKNIPFLIGRILFGGFFIFNAYNHSMQAGPIGQYAISKGVPAPTMAVLGTGIILLLGGMSILLGFKPKIGSTLILIFLVPVTLIMHDFWTVEDPSIRMREMVNFMKNTALIGAALITMAFPKPWAYSLEK